MGWFILAHLFSTHVAFGSIGRLSEGEKDLEILLLSQQVSILLRNRDRTVRTKCWTQIYRIFLTIVRRNSLWRYCSGRTLV
jgi:hypothetical protein